MDLSSLRADITFYLHRSDLTDAQVDGFIARAMERVGQSLLAVESEALAVSSWDFSGKWALPDDYRSARNIIHVTSGTELKPLSMLEAQKWSGGGSPSLGYRIADGGIRVYPANTEIYALEYFAKPALLFSSISTNWVTDSYQNLALYGSLVEAARWERDSESLAMFEQMFTDALITAQQQADRARYGAAPVASSHYQAPGAITRSK